MKILITGTAGFIGFHLTQKLVKTDNDIIGLDVINDYYDINLKYARLAESGISKESVALNKLIQSSIHANYRFVQANLLDKAYLDKLFATEQFDYVCHLAAQAGVRYSLTNPYAYLDSNYSGFLNILEACRHNHIKHLVYASSSSVYGLNTLMPFSVSHNVDHPISLYAASKKSNELMAHTYSYLYNLPATGLRFFTVYGPWGRPDMALFIFTKAILEGKPIDVYNNGNMQRDFTYVDDIVEGVRRVLFTPPTPDHTWNGQQPDPSSSPAPYRIYNIGNSSPVKLLDFITAIEEALDMKAQKIFKPMQAGDVPATWADIKKLEEMIHYKPSTSVKEGVRKFVAWFKEYYR